MDTRFPKRLKLRDRSEFRRLLKEGRRLVGQYICIDWRVSECSETRLGLTVAKRYGSSPERNSFKRKMREAFRLSRTSLPPSLDLNVFPRQRAKKASSLVIQEEFSSLLHACAPARQVPCG